MKYFTAPLIGSGVGTDLLTEDPIRADLPFDQGILCVGKPHTDATYLIAAPNNTSLAEGGAIVAIADEDLDAECVARGLDPADVRSWWVAASADEPLGVQGLHVWHRADDLALADGAPIGTWTDLSGSERHLTATGSARPLFKPAVVNGHAVARFDGSNDLMAYADSTFAGVTAAEAFVVLKVDADPPGGGASTGLWSLGAAAGDMAACHFPWTDGSIYDDFGSTVRKATGNPSASLAAWRVYNVASASGAWTSRIDGVQHFTTASNAAGFRTTSLTVGRSLVTTGSFFFDGDMAELFIYDRVLAGVERAFVHAYLNARYGFSLP